jgi:hypothetical protein
MRIVIALALAGLIAAPAVAADQPAGKKKVHKVCKEIPRSGSNLPLRVCRTPSQWADNAANEADDLDMLMQQNKEAGAMSGVPADMSAPR